MTKNLTHRIARPMWLTCTTLIVALATAAASAQGPPDQRPPDQPAGPRDKSRDPAAEKKNDSRPGAPGVSGFGRQWPGPAARGRPLTPAGPARLDELDAKLDTLLDEVRQLRREIQRLRTNMQPGVSGPMSGPPFHPGAYRGGFGPAAPGAPWWGPPRFKGPHAAFGPPWGGPGRGGPQAMRDRSSRAPRAEHADRDADRPRAERDEMDRGREEPRRDRDDARSTH